MIIAILALKHINVLTNGMSFYFMINKKSRNSALETFNFGKNA
jgi:hypothetical protein